MGLIFTTRTWGWSSPHLHGSPCSESWVRSGSRPRCMEKLWSYCCSSGCRRRMNQTWGKRSGVLCRWRTRKVMSKVTVIISRYYDRSSALVKKRSTLSISHQFRSHPVKPIGCGFIHLWNSQPPDVAMIRLWERDLMKSERIGPSRAFSHDI